MLVRFWGTRGSIATPGPTTVRYGGNTSCVEVRAGQTMAILDCGTGVRGLGAQLATQGGALQTHLMLTHFHWDHIQGFPFFLPVFVPGAEVHVYGVAGLEHGLEEALSGQMQYTYFPVRLGDLRSRIAFHEVGEVTFQAGQLAVHTQFLNHAAPAVGYRLTAGGTTVAYMTDHEPFWPHNPDLPLAGALVHPGDQRHVAFVAGADLLIHDSQYTAEEYPAKRGWGHSTIEYVVDVAVAAGVRRLALFHHDPERDDQAVEGLVRRAQARARARRAELEIFAAAEGQVVELAEVSGPTASAPSLPLVASVAPARLLLLGSPERRRLLREALAEDGYRLGEAALDSSAADWGPGEPDLVLVAPSAEADAAAVVQSARRAAEGCPVVAVLEGAVDEPLLRRVSEMAADVVVAPFSPPNLRARVRACLARRQPSSALSAERSATLDNLQLVDRLPMAELEALLETAARCGFRPGEVLFRQGDGPGGVYYVHSGLARIVVDAPDGREVTVGFAGPGDTIGEMSALDGSPRSATVVAMEPTAASYISREGFRQALERAPQTSVRLLRLLARRLREVDQRLASRPNGTGPAEAVTPEASEGEEDAPALRQRLGRLQALLERLELTEEQLEQYAGEAKATYLRVREWRQGVEALRTIAQLLSAAGSPQALAREAVRTLVRLVPAQAAALYLLEEASGAARLVRVARQGRGVPKGWLLEQAPLAVTVALRLGKPQVAPEAGGESGPGDGPFMVVVPLRTEGRELGALWLRRAAAPSDDELALVEMVAVACVVALRQQRGTASSAAPAVHLADLESALELEVDRARRLGYPIGVLLGQVGREDARAGRNAESAALAEALRGTLRRSDVVAASASGELGVILPGLAPEHLALVEARVQEAICRALQGRRARRGGSEVRVGGSVVYPEEADAHQLLERALDALHSGVPTA